MKSGLMAPNRVLSMSLLALMICATVLCYIYYDKLPSINQLAYRKQIFEKRYLISRCDEKTMSGCGGWDNRINGAVLGYIIANLTGRTFKFEHLKPSCDLTRYLVPNEINWHLPQSFHDVVKGSLNNVKLVNVVDNQGFLKTIPYLNFSKTIPPDTQYAYFKGNLFSELKLKCTKVYTKELAWLKNLTRGEIKATIFKKLFKPSDYLQRKIDEIFVKNIPTTNNRLICAHLRMGSGSSSNPLDSERFHKREAAKSVWNFIEKQIKSEKDRVFVMSDSIEVVLDAKNQTFSKRLISVDGPVIHVDRNRGLRAENQCAGLERLILEQQILMKCDVLMVGRSGVSHLAAWMRGTDKDLFCHFRNGTVGSCKQTDFVVYNLNGLPANKINEECE